MALLEQSQKSVSQALDRVVTRIASQENVMQELKNKLTQLLLAEQDLADKKKSFAQLETPENQQYSTFALFFSPKLFDYYFYFN